MNAPAPTPPIGTSLEVLAPYLPYGIEVEVCSPDGFRAKLIGITPPDPLQNPVHVRDLSDGMRCDSCWLYEDVLPVLRPFSQLVEPLADGTIPAERVLDILEIPIRKREKLHINDSTLWVSAPGLAKGVWTLGRFMAPEIPMDVARYLQSAHFAVGLEPYQYIPKESAGRALPSIEGGSGASG